MFGESNSFRKKPESRCLGNPPLMRKNLLDSDPLKSRFLVCGLFLFLESKGEKLSEQRPRNGVLGCP